MPAGRSSCSSWPGPNSSPHRATSRAVSSSGTGNRWQTRRVSPTVPRSGRARNRRAVTGRPASDDVRQGRMPSPSLPDVQTGRPGRGKPRLRSDAAWGRPGPPRDRTADARDQACGDVAAASDARLSAGRRGLRGRADSGCTVHPVTRASAPRPPRARTPTRTGRAARSAQRRTAHRSPRGRSRRPRTCAN